MPIKSPGGLTSSRNRALAIGTTPAGFGDAVPMSDDECIAGYPKVIGVPAGRYKDQAAKFGAASAPPAPSPMKVR